MSRSSRHREDLSPDLRIAGGGRQRRTAEHARLVGRRHPADGAGQRVGCGPSAPAAGSISSAYQIGTAVALVFVSALADYLDPRLLFRVSAGVTAAVSLLIPVLAHGHLSALLLFGAVAVAVAGIYTPAIM